LKEDFQPDYRLTKVLRDIRQDHGVEISYSTAWRAKEQATANIYCEDILQNNPGSTVLRDVMEVF
jgi:hypothetical protein